MKRAGDSLHKLLLALLVAAQLAVSPAPTFAAPDATIAKKLMTTPRPLFFNDLVAFDTAVHRTLALPVQRKSFAFAAGANLLPLTFAEVPQALRSYPIVFLPEGNSVVLAAITGLAGGRNLFVDAWGEWRPGAYIPAYVRGYPFIAIRPTESAEPVLAFDPQALDFKTDSGQALIKADGQPSEQLKGILAFQAEYRELAERTQKMTTALKDAGVLEEGGLQLQATQKDGAAQKIGGFLVVSEPKLRALKGEALQKLMEADALGLAYAQLFSMGSLNNVFAAGGEAAAVTSTVTPAEKSKAKRARKKAE
jgi:hypothetical protein